MPAESTTRPSDEYPEPTTATVKKLYGSAFRCAEPTCARPLYKVTDETGDLVLNSRVAHIHARRRNGPRWIEMPPEANRSESNLLLLCIEHSYEIDDPALENRYPVELLREWKAAQRREYESVQRSWPLSDAEAAEAAAASFGGGHVHTELRVAIARATGAIVAAVRRTRAEPLHQIALWQATWNRVNSSYSLYDENGNRLTVQPSRQETSAHEARVVDALQRAQDSVASPADHLRADIAAASVERPELQPWLSRVSRALSAVEKAVGRWPTPPPFSDDGLLEERVAELDAAVRALAMRWQGDTTVPVPSEPEPDPEPAESDWERLIREHDELLERARPHARVDHLAPDEVLLQRLIASFVVAVAIPPTMTNLARGLNTTARLAVDTLKNAEPPVWRKTLDLCGDLEPLAGAVYLARAVAIAATKAEESVVAGDAKAVALGRLARADWASSDTWIENLCETRTCLAIAASEFGDEVVRGWLREALLANPDLVEYVVAGCSSFVEEVDREDYTRVLAVRRSYERDVPTWLPVDAIETALGAGAPGPMRNDVQELVQQLRAASTGDPE